MERATIPVEPGIRRVPAPWSTDYLARLAAAAPWLGDASFLIEPDDVEYVEVLDDPSEAMDMDRPLPMGSVFPVAYPVDRVRDTTPRDECVH